MHRPVLLVTLLFGFALTGCGDKKDDSEGKNKQKKKVDTSLFKGDKQNDLDLSFVPDDAVFVAVIHPQRMLKAPLFSDIGEEELSGLAGQGSNFDLRDLKQIVTYAGAPSMTGPGGEGNPGGAVFRFSNPQDPDQLAEQMFGSSQQQEVEGISAYVDSAEKAGLVAIDEKTCLLAPPSQLKKMIKSKSASGAAVEKLRTLPGDHDVVGVFVMNDALRAMAGFMMAMASQSPDAPPEVKEAAQIPNNLASASFLVDFSEKRFLNVAVEMNDESSAQDLKDLASKGLALVKKKMTESEGALLGPGVPKELAEKNKRIAQQLMDSLVMVREGKLVVASAEMPKDVDQAMVKAIGAARKAAELAKRKNDLKQIGLALHNYHDTNDGLPPVANPKTFDDDGKPFLSWRVHILPFLEEQALYEQFHLDESWDSEHNKPLLSQIPDVYASNANNPTLTTILMVSGEGLAYEGGTGIGLYDFLDGTANTVIVVDAGVDKAVPWTKPVDMTVNPDDPVAALGQTDAEAFPALRVDGSVMIIPKDIGHSELWALFTRAGDDLDQAGGF